MLPALAIVLVVAGGVAQAQAPSDAVVQRRVDATLRPAARQTCERSGAVTYCAFPEYRTRIDDWRTVVDAVRRRLPPEVAQQPLVVRQRVIADESGEGEPGDLLTAWADDDRRAGTPGSVPAGLGWGPIFEGGDTYALELAGRVALDAVGPGRREADPETGLVDACGAQAVVSLWLAGQVRPDTARALNELVNISEEAGVAIGMVGPPQDTETFFLSTWFLFPDYELRQTEGRLALKLLDRPADAVAETLRRNWDELTSPETTAGEAARIFGLRPPEADEPCQRG